MTYAEWGTMPSKLSEEAHKEGKKIYIYDDNGKLMYHCDHSFLYEGESHGSARGMNYSEDINSFLKDIMLKSPPKNSELAHCIMALAQQKNTLQESLNLLANEICEMGKQNKETAAGLTGLVTFMNSQITTMNQKPNKPTKAAYIQ